MRTFILTMVISIDVSYHTGRIAIGWLYKITKPNPGYYSALNISFFV